MPTFSFIFVYYTSLSNTISTFLFGNKGRLIFFIVVGSRMSRRVEEEKQEEQEDKQQKQEKQEDKQQKQGGEM